MHQRTTGTVRFIHTSSERYKKIIAIEPANREFAFNRDRLDQLDGKISTHEITQTTTRKYPIKRNPHLESDKL